MILQNFKITCFLKYYYLKVCCTILLFEVSHQFKKSIFDYVGAHFFPSPKWKIFQKQKFNKISKKCGLGRTSAFIGGLLGKRGWLFQGELQFSHKSKLKSEIFNDKKSLKVKIFFCVITKISNWEILPKNLVTFER